MPDLKKILIESGDYILKSTIKIPAKDIFIVGNQGALIVPEPKVLPIEGVGDEDILCPKCDYVLAKGVARTQILVPIKCPSCKTVIYL